MKWIHSMVCILVRILWAGGWLTICQAIKQENVKVPRSNFGEHVLQRKTDTNNGPKKHAEIQIFMSRHSNLNTWKGGSRSTLLSVQRIWGKPGSTPLFSDSSRGRPWGETTWFNVSCFSSWLLHLGYTLTFSNLPLKDVADIFYNRWFVCGAERGSARYLKCLPQCLFRGSTGGGVQDALGRSFATFFFFFSSCCLYLWCLERNLGSCACQASTYPLS